MAPVDIEDLVKLSALVADDPRLVQGGGGNTSVKSASGRSMAIKASGFRLSEVSAQAGWVGVDLDRMDALLVGAGLLGRSSREAHESSILLIQRAANHQHLRPSLETTFHAWLPGRVVLHTHSVWANLYGCAIGGREWLEADWTARGQQLCWVPYETPGLLLGESVRKAQTSCSSACVLLENHGWLTHADHVAEAFQLHTLIQPLAEARFGSVPCASKAREPHPLARIVSERLATVLSRLNGSAFARPSALNLLSGPADVCPALGPVVPDDVVCGLHRIERFPDLRALDRACEELSVRLPSMGALWCDESGFLLFGPSAKAVDAVEQNLLANVMIHSILGRSGCKARLLRPAEVDYLASMESESYRQRIASRDGR